MRRQQTGDLAGAAGFCRQILAENPDQPDALHLMGVIEHLSRRSESAVQFIRRAIAVRPDSAEFHANLGLILSDCGRHEEAVAACRKALELSPDYVVALNNLGNSLCALRRFDEAISAYERALQLQPRNAGAANNLGNAFKGLGRMDEAIGAYRRAIAMQPGYASALCNLGQALMRMGRFDEAAAWSREALAADEGFAAAHQCLGTAMLRIYDQGEDPVALEQAVAHLGRAVSLMGSAESTGEVLANLGKALVATGRTDEAVSACRRAVELRPDLAEAHNNLGTALAATGRLPAAISAYEAALRLQPDLAQAHHNLSLAFYQGLRLDQAEAACRKAIQLRPEFADAHLTLGTIRFLRGDLPGAWPEYEWRWKATGRRRPPMKLGGALWDGSDLGGGTLLLHAEQGLGDTIQFARFVSPAARRCGRVVLYCPPELCGLLRNLHGPHSTAAWDQPPPAFDAHCPLMSLPRLFNTELANIPAKTPYLSADSARKTAWKSRLDGQDGLKIGLAWAGNPAHAADRDRSIPPAELAPLGRLPGTRLISLQKGQAAGAGMALTDWTGELHDLADTAALIENLDLVVTADTAIAHLAGALGRRVWVLLPFVPDWRWMLDREDSPWYPTMRLFRQKAKGDWTWPIEEVVKALKEN
jgi:tetratricopeptide (TPR) repeat protein